MQNKDHRYRLLQENETDNAPPIFSAPSSSVQKLLFIVLGAFIALAILYTFSSEFRGESERQNSVMNAVLAELEELERKIDRTERPVTPTISVMAEPRLSKRPETADIDCARVLKGDKNYTNTVKGRKLKPTPDDKMDMSCEGIRSRILPAHNADESFPIAFAKAVFTEQLTINYAAENWYCFSLDTKSQVLFRRHFVALSTCLLNVVLIDHEYATDSAGHFENNAHFDCMQKLKEKAWKYIIFQQNHDVMIKTQHEVKTILRALNGSNDVELLQCANGRCNGIETNLGKLGICPKNLKKDEAARCAASNVAWGKGLIQVSLSRKTSDYIMDNLNLTTMLGHLNKKNYGIDEIIVQTLHVNPQIKLPGGYPFKCLPRLPMPVDKQVMMTRYTHWSFLDKACNGAWRHMICVFGIGDVSRLSSVNYIMANKLMPETDYGAITCINEILFNRTNRGLNDHPLNMDAYEKLPLVRLRKALEKDPKSFDKFECPTF